MQLKSKTEYIVFSKKQSDLRDIAPVLVNGDPLPWVHQVKHLGNILQSDNSMTTDCTVKRGVFIGKVNSLFQEFSFAAPKVKLKLVNIFASSFYGSGLWDLSSSACERLYKSWNVAVRLGYGVPPTTHRYLIEPMSAIPHAKTMLCSRLVGLKNQLIHSSKLVVRLMAMMSMDDKRTVLGKNLMNIRKEIDVQSVLTCNLVKKYHKYFQVPEEEVWRLEYLDDLVDTDGRIKPIENFSEKDVKQLVSALCTA